MNGPTSPIRPVIARFSASLSYWSDRFSPRVVSPLSWALLAAMVLIDLVWFLISPMRFAISNFRVIAAILFVFSLWFCIFRVIFYRLSGDWSPLAKAISAVARGAEIFLRAFAFTVLFGWAGGTFVCLATSAALPLQDTRLAALDRMLGFDWLQFLAFTNSYAAISQSLVLAYHSALPQMLFLYLLLSFGRREARLAEFLSLFCLTFSATCFLMLLVPAAGAYSHYHPSREAFDGFSVDAGMWHYQTFTMLRTQSAAVIKMEHLKGLVTFPSFHTALAIITAYAVRNIRFIVLPAVVLNGIVIISTLPEGGHFLVDVLAGAVIALGAIGLSRGPPFGRLMKCRM